MGSKFSFLPEVHYTSNAASESILMSTFKEISGIGWVGAEKDTECGSLNSGSYRLQFCSSDTNFRSNYIESVQYLEGN